MGGESVLCDSHQIVAFQRSKLASIRTDVGPAVGAAAESDVGSGVGRFDPSEAVFSDERTALVGVVGVWKKNLRAVNTCDFEVRFHCAI